MTWKQLVDDRRLKPHQTSYRELYDLRELIDRDMQDAALKELSTDRRFATAYNAVLQLGKMVLACAGYRAGGPGHHQTTFDSLELAMGPAVADLAAYFDACRRKRNQLDYDMAHVATEGEAAELLRKAHEFRRIVEAWIAGQYPQLRTDSS